MMKIVFPQRWVSISTLFFYVLATASIGQKIYGAQVGDSLMVSDTSSRSKPYQRADEFFSEDYQGEILVPVHLLGAVGRPGVYHLPKQTDIIRLLSLAGGTRSDANLEDISIKRRNGESEKLIEINLKDLVKDVGSHKPINLEANDVILVTPQSPAVSNNLVNVVGFAASLLGLVVSSIVIVNQLKNK
jgi:competence protein ComEA